MWKIMRQWLPSLTIAIVVALILNTYVAQAMRVPTGSMIPTIEVNDHLIVEKMLWLTTLKRGDIVVFYPPFGDLKYVKRLIGLPGDLIEINNGELYRNHELVDEPYINEKMDYSFGPVTVPEGNYFFLGDNRNVSYDAHLWEQPFVPKADLIGKVLIDIPTHHLYK
jgi:signal peptidase I